MAKKKKTKKKVARKVTKKKATKKKTTKKKATKKEIIKEETKTELSAPASIDNPQDQASNSDYISENEQTLDNDESITSEDTRGPSLSDEYNPDDDNADNASGDYSYGWNYDDGFDKPEEVENEDEPYDEDEELSLIHI